MNAPDRIVTVREATAEDLSAVIDLYVVSLGDAEALSREEAEVMFDRMRAYPDFRLNVAESGGRVVGTYSLLVIQNLSHAGRRSGLVESVAVHPYWQRRGIGRAMMAEALAHCRRRGCYKVMLSSNAKRESAHRFYQALGFRRHGFSFEVTP